MRTMDLNIIYSYPSPPNCWHRELMRIIIILYIYYTTKSVGHSQDGYNYHTFTYLQARLVPVTTQQKTGSSHHTPKDWFQSPHLRENFNPFPNKSNTLTTWRLFLHHAAVIQIPNTTLQQGQKIKENLEVCTKESYNLPILLVIPQSNCNEKEFWSTATLQTELANRKVEYLPIALFNIYSSRKKSLWTLLSDDVLASAIAKIIKTQLELYRWIFHCFQFATIIQVLGKKWRKDQRMWDVDMEEDAKNIIDGEED